MVKYMISKIRRRPSAAQEGNDPDKLRPLSDDERTRIPAVDMIQAAFDVAAPTPTRELVLILSTERSGSTLLCEQLAALDYCYAHEYFQPSQYLQILAARWPFVEDDRINWMKFADALRRYRTAPNGVLGINLHGRHLNLFLRAAPHFADLPTRYVHMTRRDIIAQALSFDAARQSGQWSSHFQSHVEPEYVYAKVKQAMAWLQEQNARIAAFLELTDASFAPVVYEDLVASPTSTLARLTGLSENRIETALARPRDTAVTRQADSSRSTALKKLFVQQFLEETDPLRP